MLDIKFRAGMPNDLILKNFQTLVTEFPDLPITARTPVIPGFNDHGPDIKAICDFLKPFEHVKYEMPRRSSSPRPPAPRWRCWPQASARLP